MRLTLLLFSCLGLLAVTVAAAATVGADAERRFLDLAAREWAWRLREFPLLATAAGVHDFDDRLADESLAAYARRDAETQELLRELAAISRDQLPSPRRTDYDILREQLADRVAAYGFGEHLMPLNADSGFHTGFALLPMQVPLSTVRDYDNYLARLAALPRAIDDNIALLAEGLTRGITVPRATLVGIETSVLPLAEVAPEEHPLWAPFRELPAPFPAAERERLAAAGRATLAGAVIPAYGRFLRFLTERYLPGARATIAAVDLPRGEEYYAFLVRRFTTLELTVEEIHRLGVAELAAIHAAMERVRAKTGFSGDLAAFVAHLRGDPRYYAKSPEELLREAAWIAKRMDGKLPALFGRLPRQPYGVMAVPPALAPKYTSGRYSASPQDSTEPGWYWVNTYALDKRPLYNLTALTLHEAVPGHHLQGALAEEAGEVLPFRRFSYISAFGEGWGLYAEWLGIEAGMYDDPYAEFGLLGYQAWRAARLVVDTGVHALGWSRQQAIDYLASATALPLHEVTTEVDRYISWPGQALSYYVGYRELRRLRAEAEAALGAEFDVRAFHDAVLEQGSVPLPVLAERVARFVAERRSAAGR